MNRFDPYENTSGPLDNYRDSLELQNEPLNNYNDPMTRVDPFADNPQLFKEIINWSHDPMNKPQNQNKYFFSDGKTYYEQICKMLKLMAVFKDAFNQIYDNEDEIHEAWENFVENLSASATAGDEASVTLVWTDESVQFQFVMPKGQKGDKGDQGDPGQDGVSITNIAFNADYTITITLSNGNTYTSPSLKGEKGDPGEGLKILDIYATLAELEQAHPTGQPGDAYLIGTDPNYTLYIWSASQSDWVPAGSLTAPSPSTSTPLMDGTASTGSENAYSRGDHVHPTDTSRASASDLTALSGTVTTLSGDLITLSGNVTTLSGTVTTLDTTVGTISGNVTQLQSDMTQAQGDITQLQSDVTDITEDVTQLQTDVGTLDDRVDTLSDDLTVLEEIVTGSNDLDDQQFLYRKAPTDHDTIARINSIKGNTVKFNQLIQNGNFADTSAWNNNGNFTVSNNVATFQATTRYGNIYQNIVGTNFNLTGHKILYTFSAKSYTNSQTNVIIRNMQTGTYTDFVLTLSATEQQYKGIYEVPTSNYNRFFIQDNNASNWGVITIKNVMLFDLSAIFGLGNEPTTVSDFETWLSNNIGLLPYYDYTQGTLIPFMGSGLKTTGKNLFNKNAIQSSKVISFDTGFIYNNNSFWTSDYIDVHGQNNIAVSGSADFNSDEQWFYDSLKNPLQQALNTKVGNIITIPSGAYYYAFSRLNSESVDTAQVEFGSSASSYEPYTSNTLPLPTLTYFPTGMKEAGSVYDELAESKATARFGSVDSSSNDWTLEPGTSAGGLHFVQYLNSNIKMNGIALCNVLPQNNSGWDSTTPVFQIAPSANRIRVYGTFTSLAEFQSQYANLVIYYELATPTETTINPPLDLTYPVWNNGTEQILPVNGSTPDTAPIRGDFSYMSTDEAIQYLYDHISASVQTELDNLDERVTDTETSISNLETDLNNYYHIEETDIGYGTFPANGKTTFSTLATAVTGYKAVGIAGYKFYRLVSGDEYNADGMMMSYIFCNPTTQYINLHIENTSAVALENLRTRIYVLYFKDNGGN